MLKSSQALLSQPTSFTSFTPSSSSPSSFTSSSSSRSSFTSSLSSFGVTKGLCDCVTVVDCDCEGDIVGRMEEGYSDVVTSTSTSKSSSSFPFLSCFLSVPSSSTTSSSFSSSVFSSSNDLREPSSDLKLSDFDIRSTLGCGSYGTVVLAAINNKKYEQSTVYSDCSNDECQDIANNGSPLCVLKIMSKEVIVCHRQVEHVINERDVLLRVHHPFIVNIITSFQDETNLYIAMEFVPGGELYNRMEMSPLCESDAVFYSSQVVLALEYLHKHNIIYRDIKPENIMLKMNGYIKLVDFGFARVLDEGTQRYTVCGTAEYLAPEVLARGGYGKAVDYWGLGVLLYDMCAGRTPFAAKSKKEIYKRIRACSYTLLDSFSDSLKEIVSRLLVDDPLMRLGVAEMGMDTVKSHDFFKDCDWNAIITQKAQAPYFPQESNVGGCNSTPPHLTMLADPEDMFPGLFTEYRWGK
eukprot:m.90944 g.90944  ORF g.90944 m.90944 type:complete len:466 (+) comp12320_c0_seq8:83-1480(+)